MNERGQEAAGFIDATLQNEGTWYRAEDVESRVALLRHTDLTRLEGFIRSAQTGELVDPLIADVVVPLLQGLGESDRPRADVVISRWHQDPDDALRHAARLIASQGTDLQRISGNRGRGRG